MKILCTLPGSLIPIYDNGDGSYSAIHRPFNVDGDGSGGNPENDPDFQPDTTLHYQGKAINARAVPGIVIPPAPIMAVGPKVIGCKAQCRNEVTGHIEPAVVHDIGPSRKFGEGTICLASRMGVDPNPVTGGDQNPIYTFTWWPGAPALVDGIQYELQPI